ncbi:hypothetical protein [Pedobacter aquatilis]|uniref:hypothetical protein n=1 Tax=Pedobacter aquatilis TaxID=351343 RepID=UPI002931E021|nr:hypothetical protein [Pedobacter aquatilis]
MIADNKFTHFDQIGNDIISKMIGWSTFQTNKLDKFGWWDSSGTTFFGHRILQEIKCNSSNQRNFSTTIITKHDFDKLVANTPEDVEAFYFIIMNSVTYCLNLKKIAADADVFEIKKQVNRNTTMGSIGYYREEEWVYINKSKAVKKGYMRVLKKGGLNYGYNIDKLLKGN